MTDSNYQTWTVTEPWLDINCGLGEAPYYESTTNTLRFVDIIKKRLHTVSLTQGPSSLETLQFDMPVGVTADIEGVDPAKKILVGGKSGVYLLDRENGETELLKRFYDSEEKDDRLRSNDGAVDPQGRFWIGTMNDFHVGEPGPEGVFFVVFFHIYFLFACYFLVCFMAQTYLVEDLENVSIVMMDISSCEVTTGGDPNTILSWETLKFWKGTGVHRMMKQERSCGLSVFLFFVPLFLLYSSCILVCFFYIRVTSLK